MPLITVGGQQVPDRNAACADPDTDESCVAWKADEKLLLASRNLPWVGVLEHGQVNPVSLVAYDKVIATKAAIEAIEERLK